MVIMASTHEDRVGAKHSLVSCHRDGRKTSLEVACVDGVQRQLFFNADGAELYWRDEAFVLSGLISAMSHSGRIECGNPLDAMFQANLDRAQRILVDWIPSLHKCVFEKSGQQEACSPFDAPPPHRVLSYFSGGVDSFYTLFQNPQEISALVFVAGFSPSLDEMVRCERAISSIRKVAAAMGKELIVVTTNLRDFMEKVIRPVPSLSPWEMAHGTALATVAHLVAGEGARVLIPASFCHQDAVMPWGSHPLLDPLWSSSRVRVVSDGYWANRVDKCACIAENQLALDNLIVCYQRSAIQPLNCGCCEKCILTMIGLLACGALDRTPVFGYPLEADRVAEMPIVREEVFLHDCNLRALEQRGIRPDIQKALRHAIRHAYTVETEPASPWIRTIARLFAR